MAHSRSQTNSRHSSGKHGRSGRSQASGVSGSGQGRVRAKGVAGLKASFERYTALAQAAVAAGDPVESENCYQHAEHYFRLLKAKTA